MEADKKTCSIHQSKSIIGFCINKLCKKPRPSCLLCLREVHPEHFREIMDYDEVKKLITNTSKSLESILYQIIELESIIKVLKISFESLIQNTPQDQDSLIDQIETVLRIDDASLKACSIAYETTLKQFGKYSESIFNFKMDEFQITENIEKLNQMKQLIKKDGCSKSFQVFENFLTQNQQSMTQFTKIQSLLTTIFQVQGIVSEKQQTSQENFQFTPNLAPTNITFEQNYKKAVQTINQDPRMALIQPGLGKTGCIKIRFRICKLVNWIALGICKKGIVQKNNYHFINYNAPGHGHYMISSNSHTWSHLEQTVNQKTTENFQFGNNDIIAVVVDLDKTTITWNHETKNLQYNMKFQLDDDLFICAALLYQGDCVEMIE